MGWDRSTSSIENLGALFVMTQQDGNISVPPGDDLTPGQCVCRMLEIIEDLLPLASLSQEEFHQIKRRDEAGAYAANLGRCAARLPREFVEQHPEINWGALTDFRYTAFHDGIDVLIFHDRLREALPAMKDRLQKILAAATPADDLD